MSHFRGFLRWPPEKADHQVDDDGDFPPHEQTRLVRGATGQVVARPKTERRGRAGMEQGPDELTE